MDYKNLQGRSASECCDLLPGRVELKMKEPRKHKK